MDQILTIKIISAILYPLGFAIFIFIIAWFVSVFRWNKSAVLLKTISLMIIILASNPMIAKKLIQSLERQHPQQTLSEITKHDAIIVLGGGLRIPLPPAVHTQIGFGSDRYWYAVRLYKSGKADKIILAGGNVFTQPGFKGEAHYASELLQKWGIPKSAIAIESQSRTTKQNFNNTADYIQATNIQSVLLVTSAYHMPRALRAFNALGIRLTPASADILIRDQFSPQVFNYLPSVSALSLSTIAAHEYYGMWFASLKAWIVKG